VSYRNPTPTVDVLIEVTGGLVFIRRKNPPLGWALPGGFVDEGETVEAAAVREAREETGLHVRLTDLLYVYSNPARDPRSHTLSVAFVCNAQGTPRALDDAIDVVIAPAETPPQPLVFDHAQIVADYVRYKSTGERPDPSSGTR
jgi:8-oxo-dGTP diphosphatase